MIAPQTRGQRRRDGMEPQARILVVDDDEASRRIITKLLTAQGYQVYTAANGQQA